jgi:magnesium transporter
MLVRAPSDVTSLREAIWIDLYAPTEAERREVETATELRLPDKNAIEEIETSSRVYVEDGALYLSTPVLGGTDCVHDMLTSIGFVLTPERLVTLRYADLPAFRELAKAQAKQRDASASGTFVRLLEIIVDHTADALEHAGAELERISHEAFRAEQPHRRHARMNRDLRASLRKLGRMSDGVSHVRDALLGLGRVATFVNETGGQYGLELTPRQLSAIRGDLASLTDYQAHLAGKVQFLLDATLGFISIQQNDIVKTLTIVSVVGVPPVLIAGVYGMNFRYMPELSWPLGYPYALGLIVVSGLLPLVWMKWRGWM